MYPNILTPSGYKSLSAMTIGDDVIAYDINTGDVILNQLLDVEEWTQSNDGSDFDWYLINGTYKLYKDQSIWVDMQVKHTYELVTGQTIYNDLDGDILITDIYQITPEEKWYRLHISNDHSYIADGITLHNATRTISNAGGNYNTGSTWVEGSVPTSADDVVATATSGNLTVNAASAAKSADFTNYTGTLTMNTSQTWTVQNDFKLVSGMTVTGTGTLAINNTSTITSAGKTWTGNLTIGTSTATFTVTLADNLTVVGAFTSSVAGAKTMNGNRLYAQGNIGFSTTATIGGTTVLEISGNATQTITGTYMALPTVINKSGGSLTIGSWTFYGSSLDYIAGTVNITSGTTLQFLVAAGSSQVINTTSAITWQNVTMGANVGGSGTLTFTSAFNIAGTWTSFSTGIFNINGCSFISTIPTMNIPATSGAITYSLDAPITVSGTLTVTGTNGGSLSGTSTIYLQGNLALSGSGGIAGAGTLEMNGTSKTITSTAGATLSCNFTINSSSITLNSGSTLRYSTRTFKLNFPLLGTGTVAITGNATIDGGGNSVEYLWFLTAGITVTLSSGLVINSQFQSLAGTAASRVTLVSSSSGVQRKFTLLNNGVATQSVLYTNATDIDSGDGQTIWSFGTPTLTNTINWGELTPYRTRGFIYG